MNQGQSTDFRAWEYAHAGDYHRNLDPNWSYTPTYLRKMAFVRAFVTSLPRSTKFIDIACGEGVLVEDFRKEGWNIEGLDLNYESEYVRQGDVRAMPYDDGSFDVVVFLDAFEHLAFVDQPKALADVRRILRPGGILVMSAPNLAHLNSRVRMLLKGGLDRTDIEINHVGERPIWEYEELLKQAGFTLEQKIGVTLTVPYIYRSLICKHAAKLRWLHDALEPVAKAFPSLAMVTIFVCTNGSAPPSSDGRS